LRLQEQILVDLENVRAHWWPNFGDTATIAAVTNYVKSSKYGTDDDNPSLWISLHIQSWDEINPKVTIWIEICFLISLQRAWILLLKDGC